MTHHHHQITDLSMIFSFSLQPLQASSWQPPQFQKKTFEPSSRPITETKQKANSQKVSQDP